MDPSPLPVFKSSPWRAIQNVISTPNWVGNVLWLSLAALASSIFIGYIGVFGYGAELIKRRAGRPENPPVDIDSERLGDYFSQGIWAFLVFMVAQVVASIIILVPIALIVGVIAAVAAATNEEALVGGTVILMIPIVFLVSVGLYLAVTPFLIRAMVCQDFAKSFDLGWCLGFARLMAGEMIGSGIIFALLGAAIMLIGYLALCVGAIPASGIVVGGYVNLLAQWYEIYLSKGGIPAADPEADDIVEASVVS